MRVVGLDLSLRSTGVAAEEGATCISPPEKNGKPTILGTDRLFWIRRQVLDAVHSLSIEEGQPFCLGCHAHGAHPSLVVVEDYAFSRGDAHAHELGELGGVVKVEFVHRGVPYVVVKPSGRAKVATGKGNAGKSEVLAEAIKRLGYSGHSFDEADAMWLREMALQAYGQGSVELPAKHLEAVTAVTWPTVIGEVPAPELVRSVESHPAGSA